MRYLIIQTLKKHFFATKKWTFQEKLFYILYSIILFSLFLYSFTQIDLSLTFSRIDFLRNLVKSFQYIGYFNRPLSATLFIILMLLLTAFYLLFLKAAIQKKITKQFFWTLLFTTTMLLTISYNAFSYDLFNYIFDAKIITYYHQNPYEHKALDYPGDKMLSFMHWTHRTYPYGPVWLILTVPLSFLGFTLFLPTFFLFKILIGLSFFGSVYFIGKIMQKISPENELFALVFFGLNPLVLEELLISAHMDSVMIFFALWSLFLLFQKKYIRAFMLFAISVGIKYVTIFLLPVFILIVLQQKHKITISMEKLLFLAVGSLIAAIIALSFRTNFQPWYLMLLLSFAVFLSNKYYILLPSIIISSFALMTYVPYLYTGNWDPPIPEYLSLLYISSYGFSLVVVLFYYFLTTQQTFKTSTNRLKKFAAARLKIRNK